MNAALLFIVLCAGAAVVALLLALWPLLRRGESIERMLPAEAAQRASLREAAVAIEAEQGSGALSIADADALRRDLLLRARSENVAASEAALPYAASRPLRGIALAVGLAMAVAATVGYFVVGRPDTLGAQTAARPAPAAASATQATMLGGQPQVTPEQINAMVGKLETRLLAAPPKAEDLTAWKMLARSYRVIGNAQKSAVAYRAIVGLEGASNENTLNLVEALLAQTDGKPDAEAKALLAAALKRDPQDQKALWLNAAAAQESGNKLAAIGFLKTLQKQLSPESDEGKTVQRFITELSQ